MLKAVKVNNITRLLADFGVGHLNVIYMTNFERTSNWRRARGTKFNTISKILKMVSGEEINSEGILSNYKSNFLNYIEIRSENCGLTIVHVSSSGFAIQRHVVRMRLNTLPMANLRLEYLALYCVMCIKSIYEMFSQIPLDKSFILLHFDVISMRTRTGQYKTRTADYGVRTTYKPRSEV